jgi:phage pi2 protein 07
MIIDMQSLRNRDPLEVVVILFANPNKPFVKNNILNDIAYANERSKRAINFFYAGYNDERKNGNPDEIEIEIEIDAPKGKKWYFNVKTFIDFISRIENDSKWEYSGETELLLLDFRDGELHFDKSLVIWLDRDVREKRIYSVSNLFENIYRIVRSKGNTSSLIDEVCAFLNDNRGNSNIFKVEDLSKK